MTPADFTLSAVPLRGALAPIATLLSDGDGVLVDAGNNDGWWGRIGTPNRPRYTEQGWVWVEAWCWCHTPLSRLDSVDLTTSPAARSAVVAWLTSQGHTDAGKDDAALLNALRAVCGLGALVAPADTNTNTNTEDIPF